MAEATGIPALDEAIDQFACSTFRWRHRDSSIYSERDVADLRRPEVARAQCGDVADQFSCFLGQQGIDTARSSIEDELWLTPEHWGYEDRPNPGIPAHAVTLVDAEGHLYAIDWTAAQYGYTQFPLVQRLGEDGFRWEREWDSETAAPVPLMPSA